MHVSNLDLCLMRTCTRHHDPFSLQPLLEGLRSLTKQGSDGKEKRRKMFVSHSPCVGADGESLHPHLFTREHFPVVSSTRCTFLLARVLVYFLEFPRLACCSPLIVRLECGCKCTVFARNVIFGTAVFRADRYHHRIYLSPR